MKQISILFTISILFYFSCKPRSFNQTGTANEYFTIVTVAEETPLFSTSNIIGTGLLIVGDSVLLVRTDGINAMTHFAGWRVSDQQKTRPYFSIGRAPGKSLGFLSYGIYENKLWVNDIVKNRVIISNIAEPDSPNVEKSCPIFYYWTQLQNDSILVGSGNYDSDYKIELLNLHTGKVFRQMIPYSSVNNKSMPREKKMAYESFLYMRPQNDKCVLARRYADEIEIVDLKNQTAKIVKGPEGFLPDVMEAKGNDGKMLSTRNDDTRYAFVKVKGTNEFIYLLYSGYNHYSAHFDYGNSIFVYDWDGNPVSKLSFAGDVADFAVTTDNRIVYALRTKDNTVTKTIINLAK